MSLPFDGFKAAQTGLVDMGNISFYNTGADADLQSVRAGAVQHQLQRDRAERHLGAAAGERRARSTRRSSTARSSRSTSSTPPTTPTSASSSGCGAASPRPSGSRRSTARRSRSPARTRSIPAPTPPDDRPLLDRRLHQRLAEPAERARHQVRRHGDHPRHLADGRGLRHRRALRAVADERGRVVQPRRRHGEPDRPAADGRLQRCRRNADAARGDRRLLSMVDDAARLHLQRASTCSTAATSWPTATSRSPSCSRRGTRPASSRPAIMPCAIRSMRPTTSSTASSPRRHASSPAPSATASRRPRRSSWSTTPAGRARSPTASCWNAGNIELWDFPTTAGPPNGFLSFSPQQAAGPGRHPRPPAARRRPPARRTTARRSASSHRAPSPARPAASPSPAPTPCCSPATRRPASYSVTLTSLNGGTLGIGGLDRPLRRDQRHDAELQRLAVDGEHGARATHRHGVVGHRRGAHRGDRQQRQLRRARCRRADRDPGRAAHRHARDCWPPTSSSASPAAARSWSARARAATFDVAGQLGNSGILVVGGVQSQLSLSGDLDAQRQHVVARGAVAQRLQHREPRDRRRLVGRDRQQHVLLGHARAANTINNTGGTIRGNGTLDATGSASIGNTGTIEAVADFTLGSQRLVVADNLTGTGKLLIDAGATLVLSGHGRRTQTITFAANTATPVRAAPSIRPAPSCWASRGSLTGTTSINGFTFADRLVLENVTLSTTAATPVAYDSGTSTLTVTLAGGATLELLAHRTAI